MGAGAGGGTVGSVIGIGSGKCRKRLSTCRAAKTGDPAGTGVTDIGMKRSAAEQGLDPDSKSEPTDSSGVGVILREKGSGALKSLVGSVKGRAVVRAGIPTEVVGGRGFATYLGPELEDGDEFAQGGLMRIV